MLAEKAIKIEPFAVGFMNAYGKNREYQIASGIKCFAENTEISINPSDWFVAPVGQMYKSAVRYERPCGIVFEEKCGDKEIENHPEAEDDIESVMRYFRTMDTPRVISKVRTPVQEKLEANACAWAAGGGHSNPDYEMILRIGTNGIREKIALFRKVHTDRDEFYDSLLIALSAVEIIADRYRQKAIEMLETANEEDAKVLRRMIRTFEHIPQNQPRDFFEACQMFWLMFAFIDVDSPGLFDYAMGPYYEKSDKEDRYQCLEKLWECFHKTRTWNLCISGSDEFWNDKTNELTYDVLRIAREKKLCTPNITMRVHKNTPEKLWKEAAETLASGIGMPAIYSDECVCTALEAIGIPPSDAHLYCMNGCNQIDIFGKSHMGLEDGEISVAKALEFALFDGVCKLAEEKLGLSTGYAGDFKSFEEVKAAFYKQVDYLSEYITTTSNKAQAIFAVEAPNPWKSLMIQGCIEKGLDYKNRGPIYGHAQILTEGLPDAVDSLYAIKKLVFDEGKYTMAQLVDALDKDFEGYDDLYQDFKNCDKFGNDIEEVDNLYKEVSDYIYNWFQKVPTFRGGTFGVGCSTFSRAARYGSSLGALPNGKKRHAPLLAESIGPTPGNDRLGPTAMLNSVLRSNQYLATSGNVLQIKFSKSHFATEQGREAFIALAKTYFLRGGQTLQINVVSKEELLDAKIHPENHKDLIVRVGGFSAYFNDLSEGLQDNIIARTEVIL